jgi:hypothetical protein
LGYLSTREPAFRVVRAAGVEGEAELAFAGLHQLCGPILDGLDRLPLPQRDALATAFGLKSGPIPDRFLVGLGVLSLFAEAAERMPLLCLVDDAHWMDATSAQILAFVARRLLAERVVLMFAARSTEDDDWLQGLPEFAVRGLDLAASRAILQRALRVPIDKAVLDAIAAECRGNPLALLEMRSAWATPDIAGGFASPGAMSLPRRMEREFLQRLEPLPAPTRSLLLVAAAEPLGDSATLWRATLAMGIPIDAAEPAQAAGLIELGVRVTFRHPLVRSTIYRAAPPEDKRRVHLALAEATDPARDPDRRAWHRAQGTQATDESVAADLERVAAQARRRGGLLRLQPSSNELSD